MANAKYHAYDFGLLTNDANATADWTTDEIHAVLTDATYTPSLTSDAFLADIGGGARVADVTVTGLSIVGSAVKIAGTVTFPSVSGSVATRLALYRFVTNDADSNLLVLCDEFTAGMPVTPDGDDIEVGFDAAGIFQL